MEDARCAICGSAERVRIYEQKDRLHHVEGKFDLVRCLECKVHYLNPRPTIAELDRYYPQDYGPHRPRSDFRTFFQRFDAAFGYRKRCRAVTQRMHSGKLLDVGCGNGGFLAAMRDIGWDTLGVEINARAACIAERDLGLNIFNGDLLEAGLPHGHFDVITFWDVVEHLHEPLAYVAEARKLLKDDGLLVISTPDVGSVQARLFGKYWAGLDAPRHLCVFSRPALGAFLEKAGFEIVETAYFTGGYKVFQLSVGFVIDELIRSRKVREAIRCVLGMPVTRAALLPWFVALDLLDNGSVMTVFAKKDSRC